MIYTRDVQAVSDEEPHLKTGWVDFRVRVRPLSTRISDMSPLSSFAGHSMLVFVPRSISPSSTPRFATSSQKLQGVGANDREEDVAMAVAEV